MQHFGKQGVWVAGAALGVVGLMAAVVEVERVDRAQARERVQARERATVQLEEKSRDALRRIGEALTAARLSSESLNSMGWMGVDQLRFESSLGVVEIGTSQGPGEKRSVWLTINGDRSEIVAGVSDFAGGEVLNGLDDNTNGLIDEKGLHFFVEHGSGKSAWATVDLTLECKFRDETIQRRVSTTVSLGERLPAMRL